MKTNTAKNLLNNKGFTLVELMIVVAIIGILASIAIPNFQKYQAKARQSEAKIGLSGIYTAEKSQYVENGSYSNCVVEIGFNREAGARTYYAIGTAANLAANCGPAGGTACEAYTWDSAAAAVLTCTNASGTFLATTGATGAAATGVATTMTSSTFTFTARGKINTAGTLDTWTMTDTKALTNTVNGI